MRLETPTLAAARIPYWLHRISYLHAATPYQHSQALAQRDTSHSRERLPVFRWLSSGADFRTGILRFSGSKARLSCRQEPLSNNRYWIQYEWPALGSAVLCQALGWIGQAAWWLCKKRADGPFRFCRADPTTGPSLRFNFSTRGQGGERPLPGG